MNRYPAYKDSGIEWIGEIPERWTGKFIDTSSEFEGVGVSFIKIDVRDYDQEAVG